MTYIALAEYINISYNNAKKLANFNNRNYAYCREEIEIISNNNICNIIEHFSIKNGNESSKKTTCAGGGRKTDKQKLASTVVYNTAKDGGTVPFESTISEPFIGIYSLSFSNL